MICVSLKGRLCNQMFQIAAGMALSVDNCVPFVCSRNSLGIIPTAKETSIYRDTIFKKIKFKNIIFQNFHTHVEPADFSYKKIEYKKNTILTGYYQSEKYFKHNEEVIKKLFECDKQILDYIDKKYSNLISKENTCSVHVRRGDYLKYKDSHYNLPKKYYENCFSIKKDDHFVFFSDDIEWCKDTFKGMDCTFIEKQTDVVDFYLMSMMKNNIIANSTFSWWAGWMNNNKNKRVLAPKNWFGPKNKNLYTGDIIPENWEIIDG